MLSSTATGPPDPSNVHGGWNLNAFSGPGRPSHPRLAAEGFGQAE